MSIKEKKKAPPAPPPAPPEPGNPPGPASPAQLERMRRKQILAMVKDYQTRGANMIYLCDPFTLPLEDHTLHMTVVNINPDPSAGDIYMPKGSKNWVLHLVALERLSRAAGLVFDNTATRAIRLERDFVHYQAVGYITREGGEVVSLVADASTDLLALKEDATRKYKAIAAEKGHDDMWVENMIYRDFQSARKNMLKLTASDARAIVIRKLLSVQGPYKNKKIFEQPFVVVRCQYQRPATERTFRAAVDMLQQLYGGKPVEPAALPSPGPASAPVAGDDAMPRAEIPDPPADAEYEDLPNGDPTPPDNTMPDPEELIDAEFDLADHASRCEMLKTQSKRINLDVEAFVLGKTKLPLIEQDSNYINRMWAYVREQISIPEGEK